MRAAPIIHASARERWAQRYRDTMAPMPMRARWPRCQRLTLYHTRAWSHIATSCVAAAQSPDVPGAKIALVRAKRRRVARMLRL